jgi:hypothetical protein
VVGALGVPHRWADTLVPVTRSNAITAVRIVRGCMMTLLKMAH